MFNPSAIRPTADCDNDFEVGGDTDIWIEKTILDASPQKGAETTDGVNSPGNKQINGRIYNIGDEVGFIIEFGND